jgi:hypothetical protein
MNYYVYYETNDNNFRVLYNNDQFETLIHKPKETTYHHYELMKGYDASDEGLLKFKADMIRWNEELKNNDILSIDWFKYYSHFMAVEMTFKRLCKGKYEHFEDIDATESRYIESTHNGGLTYCNAGEHQSYGWDFSSFYPTSMSQYHFIMPHKKGKECFLTELPEDIELGFYRVMISSEHKHATKLFAFCKEHTYTSISLKHALELQDEFNFKIDLIVDNKPNAYIYPKGVRASSVFGVWCDKLFKMKLKFPKNKLIKHLLSSLHGSLSRSNNLMKTYEQIQEEGLKISIGETADYKIIDYVCNDNKEYYKLQSMIQPYRYNFRLKSFLTAYGRVKIAEVAQTNLDNCIRIQTDGIVFNKNVKLNFPLLVKDDKTTGLIKWENVNKYSDLP